MNKPLSPAFTSQHHASRLCQRGGAWQMFYSNADIMQALDALLA